MPSKRKPPQRRTPPRRTPKKKPKPKRPTAQQRRRSAAAKRGWVTRRKRARQLARERDSDLGDQVIVTDEWTPEPDYRPFEFREPIERDADVLDLQALQKLGDRAGEVYGTIEWYPKFDEVYDYIDALVEEFDLDPHELFEMAFGYSDTAVA